jgi:hypothetical protein
MAVFFLEHLLPRAVKGAHREEKRMPDNVYKVEEIVGTSETGLEEAIEGAIDRASKTIKNLLVRSFGDSGPRCGRGDRALPSQTEDRL